MRFFPYKMLCMYGKIFNIIKRITIAEKDKYKECTSQIYKTLKYRKTVLTKPALKNKQNSFQEEYM